MCEVLDCGVSGVWPQVVEMFIMQAGAQFVELIM